MRFNPFKTDEPKEQEKTYLDVKCDLCKQPMTTQSKVKMCTGELTADVPFPHTHLFHVCPSNTTTVHIMGKEYVSARAYRFFCPKKNSGRGAYWGGDAPPYVVGVEP